MGHPAIKVENFTPTREEMEAAKNFIKVLQDAKFNGTLRDVVTSLLERVAEGDSVSILSKNKEYTTSEAAEILNVSKTYLLKVIDRGELPCRKIGKHRRVRAQDLYTYKLIYEREREEALQKLYSLSNAYESEE